jgi:GNAT superfamily N-acetyltransferase
LPDSRQYLILSQDLLTLILDHCWGDGGEYGMTTTSRSDRPEPQARYLSRAAKTLLVSQVACDLATRLRTDDDSPELTHYRGIYKVRYWLEDLDDGTVSPDDARILAHITAASEGVTEDDGLVEIPVGSADLVVIPFWNGAPAFQALDDVSQDLTDLGEALLLHFDQLREDIESFEPGVVIVDKVRIDPAWRGLGLGLIGTGLAIRELSRAMSVAVLYPMEPGTESDDERAASRQRLSRYWARLGFEPWIDDTMVLDLGARLFEKRLAALTRP